MTKDEAKQYAARVRALRIATRIMYRKGMCRNETPCEKRKETVCTDCMRRWLVARAVHELRQEGRAYNHDER